MTLSEILHLDKEGRVVPKWRLEAQKFYLALTIILLATLSFGLGRLSVGEKRGGVSIEYDQSLTQATPATPASQTKTASVAASSPIPAAKQGSIVASKNGTKYHYLSCPGAKQIKEENKIYFNSPSEAEGAGYTLAANCKTQ